MTKLNRYSDEGNNREYWLTIDIMYVNLSFINTSLIYLSSLDYHVSATAHMSSRHEFF